MLGGNVFPIPIHVEEETRGKYLHNLYFESLVF